MMKIYAKYHPEVQDFGDEDATNYKADEINRENMNEFWIFIADQKSDKKKSRKKNE